jgi:hypothetical protein
MNAKNVAAMSIASKRGHSLVNTAASTLPTLKKKAYAAAWNEMLNGTTEFSPAQRSLAVEFTNHARKFMFITNLCTKNPRHVIVIWWSLEGLPFSSGAYVADAIFTHYDEHNALTLSEVTPVNPVIPVTRNIIHTYVLHIKPATPDSMDHAREIWMTHGDFPKMPPSMNIPPSVVKWRLVGAHNMKPAFPPRYTKASMAHTMTELKAKHQRVSTR